MGMNLKKHIEHLLLQEAEEMEDAEVYKYPVATRPEGKSMLNEQEKHDFMRKLGPLSMSCIIQGFCKST